MCWFIHSFAEACFNVSQVSDLVHVFTFFCVQHNLSNKIFLHYLFDMCMLKLKGRKWKILHKQILLKFNFVSTESRWVSPLCDVITGETCVAANVHNSTSEHLKTQPGRDASNHHRGITEGKTIKQRQVYLISFSP